MNKKRADDDARVQVRVLIACAYGKPDDVVEIPAAELADAKTRNEVDDHPDAVAFALAAK